MGDDRVGKVITDIITREGGFVDRAEDKGGPTKFGITLTTLTEWRGKPCTTDDVKGLSMAEAASIYRERYINGPGYNVIENDWLFALVVDTAVNNGRGRATLWLQRAAGVVEDGQLGPVTLARVNANARPIYYRLVAVRMKAYGVLVAQNASQVVFIAGWLNRLAEFVRPV